MTATKEGGAARSESSQSAQPPAPSISLPKGGGAIRGIGEKFAANPVSGTGSLTVPIATSPGRSGFGPQLSLSYDSGSGNGPFGFGRSLSLPSITRRATPPAGPRECVAKLPVPGVEAASGAGSQQAHRLPLGKLGSRSATVIIRVMSTVCF